MAGQTRGKGTQLTYDLAKRNAATYTGTAVNKIAGAFASPDKKRAIQLGQAAGSNFTKKQLTAQGQHALGSKGR